MFTTGVVCTVCGAQVYLIKPQNISFSSWKTTYNRLAVLLTKYRTIVDFRNENECHQTTPLTTSCLFLNGRRFMVWQIKHRRKTFWVSFTTNKWLNFYIVLFPQLFVIKSVRPWNGANQRSSCGIRGWPVWLVF